MATYHRQRASAGLFIAEATMVSAGTQAWYQQPSIQSMEHVEGWRKITDAVHESSGKIILQIWHPGRATHHEVSGAEVVSSTDRPIISSRIHTASGKQNYPTPRRLLEHEIPGIVDSFKAAIQNAKLAGFDGIQIHGAHGYLIDQFLRDGCNDRTDNYGGSIENRARLLFEVVDAAIAIFGPGRTGLRISPCVPSNDVTDSDPIALTTYVAQECARRQLSHLEIRHVKPDLENERAVAAAARNFMKQGLILNGGFNRETAEGALAEGRADAIAFGQAFLANPDLPARLAVNAALNPVDTKNLYSTESPNGYIDYPLMNQTTLING